MQLSSLEPSFLWLNTLNTTISFHRNRTSNVLGQNNNYAYYAQSKTKKNIAE